MNALCNNANSKLYLYEFGMKLPKLVKTTLKVGLRLTEVMNLLLSLVILMPRNDVEFLILVEEVYLMSVLTIQIISKFFDVMLRAKR